MFARLSKYGYIELKLLHRTFLYQRLAGKEVTTAPPEGVHGAKVSRRMFILLWGKLIEISHL